MTKTRKKYRLLFEIFRKLQYLLNCTFVYLGSSTDLLSGHLLLLFEFLLRTTWTPRQTNSTSWLSGAAEVFLCLIRVYQHYLLEAAATVGAKVVKVLIPTWPAWSYDHMMVHSLRKCQKCPSWCGSVTCLLKHLRLLSMYQVFVDAHTRFGIKRAHLEGLKESSESRARIPFCLSCII